MSDYQVTFGGDASELQGAIDSSKSAVGDLSSSVDQLSSSFKTSSSSSSSWSSDLTKAVEAVGAAFVAATGWIIGTGEAAVKVGDQVREAAGAFNSTTAIMGDISAVATRSGLSLNDVGSAFQNLQAKAKSGDDEITAALKAIGLSASDVANLSQDALAVKLATAFANAKDSANKAQAATELFGSAAAKLVPQLDQGAQHIQDLMAAADRAGAVIGPNLSAQLQGSSRMVSAFGDAMLELKETVIGGLLQTFVQIKPAFDALVLTFTNVVQNIATLVEGFNQLNGAGQQSRTAFGLMATGSQMFVSAIITATTAVEEFAVRVAGQLGLIGMDFTALSNVAKAFFQDIESMASTSASALYNAFHVAIQGLATEFTDLGNVAKAALSFNWSSVSAGFAQMGADARAAAAATSSAFSPTLFSNTKKAWDDMGTATAAYKAKVDQATSALENQKSAELALMRAGGTTGPAITPTNTVGNPNAPDTSNNSQAIEAAIKEAEAEVAAVKAAEEQKAMLLQAGVQLHLLTEGQKTQGTQDALQDQLQDTRDIYSQLLQLDGLKPAQHAEILAKMQQADNAYNTALLKSQIQAAEETTKNWDAATSQISSAFTGQVDGVIQGTTTLGQAFKNVLATMLGDVIKFCIEWTIKQAEAVAMNVLGINAQVAAHVAGETTKTAATEAGTGARIASEATAAAASIATTITSVMKAIAAYAAQAFAGVTAFMSSFLGPAALGVGSGVEAAVLAIGASIPAYADGSWSLPSDQIAQVHAGEMIVPAGPAANLRAAFETGRSGGGGGGITTGDFHFHIAGAKGDVVQQIRQNIHGVFKELARGKNYGSHLGIPS